MRKKVPFTSLVLFALLFLGLGGEVLGDVSAQLEQAGKLRKSKQYVQAEQLYKEIVAAHAQTGYGLEAQERLTRMYVWWGKETEAQAAFATLLSDYSQHELLSAAVTHVADTYRRSKRHTTADELYRYVINRWPDDEHALWSQMGLVICKRALEDLSGAEAALEKLRTQYSGHKMLPKAIGLLGDNYRKAGQPQKARELYEYGLANWPSSKHALWTRAGLAMANIRLMRFDSAEAEVDKLLAEAGEDARIAGAACTIATEYRVAERFEEAAELYEYVMDHRPDANCALSAQMGLAISNIRLGRDTAAAAAVDELLADFADRPRIASAACWIGDLYRKSGKYQEACELYQYVVDNHPEAERALWSQMGLAISYCRLNDDGKAGTAIEQMWAKFSDRNQFPIAVLKIGEFYYNQAFAREAQGNGEQAKEYYRKAVAEWERIIGGLPESTATVTAYSLSADCYRRLGQYEKVVEYYETLIERWPDYELAWNVLLLLGRAYQSSVQTGAISKPEADAKTAAVYRQLLEKYPKCKAAKIAKRWLANHNPK